MTDTPTHSASHTSDATSATGTSASGTNAPAVPDLREPLFAAHDWYAGLVAGVHDDELTEPTPCTDFDVRTLMAHMSTVLEKVVAFGLEHRDPFLDDVEHDGSRDEIREREAKSTIDGLTPEQRAQHVRERTEAARAAWTDDVLDTPIQLGWGPVLPGRLVAGIYLMEVLVHAWDLARATGQPSEAPLEVAQAGLAAARAGLPESPRGEEVGVPFGAVVVAAPDAGPTEALANWTGRVSRS